MSEVRKETNDSKRFFRRFEFWIVIFAMAFAIGFMLPGYEPVNDPGVRPIAPEPSNIVRSFKLDSRVSVVEFRDSAGRVCVLAGTVSAGWGGRSLALDCGLPAPPLDYERLPEPAITPLPDDAPLEKRPL